MERSFSNSVCLHMCPFTAGKLSGQYACVPVCMCVHVCIHPFVLCCCCFEPQNRKECKYFLMFPGSQPPLGTDKSLCFFFLLLSFHQLKLWPIPSEALGQGQPQPSTSIVVLAESSLKMNGYSFGTKIVFLTRRKNNFVELRIHLFSKKTGGESIAVCVI